MKILLAQELVGELDRDEREGSGPVAAGATSEELLDLSVDQGRELVDIVRPLIAADRQALAGNLDLDRSLH